MNETKYELRTWGHYVNEYALHSVHATRYAAERERDRLRAERDNHLRDYRIVERVA